MAKVGANDVIGGDIGDDGDEPQAKDTGSGGGGSGGVAAHPDHWVQSDNSRSGWYYKILTGDTLWGIAVTYLEDGLRWREIWDYQSPGFRQGKSPDNIKVGSLLEAPPDLIAGAAALGVLKEAVDQKRKKDDLIDQGTPVAGWKVGLAVGGAVVGLGLVGTAIWLASRKRRA